LIKRLLIETCPKCNQELDTTTSDSYKAVVVKSCPNNHFKKEFHPALETYIESEKIS